MLSIEKSFEIFLKHNGYEFISESFALTLNVPVLDKKEKLT